MCDTFAAESQATEEKYERTNRWTSPLRNPPEAGLNNAKLNFS